MYKMLIVDPDKDARQEIKEYVTRSKLEIDSILECESGIDAINLVLTEKPDICFMEIKLQGRTGLEVAEQVKIANSHCQIIFATSYNYFDYAVKALRLGVMDFIEKPLKKTNVIRVLNRAIDHLDEETERKNYELRIIDMSYVLEKRILRELVTSQIDEETLWFLEGMGVKPDAVCASFIWQLGNELNEEEKMLLSRQLRSELSETGYKHILFVHNRSIDFIVFGNLTLQVDVVEETVRNIFQIALADFKVESTNSVGTWVQNVFSLEESYAVACHTLKIDTLSPAIDIAPNKSSVRGGGRPQASFPMEIQVMCDYIKDHYMDKISLEDIAKHVNFSKYYGSRIFKQYTGKTIMEYLIQVRIEKSKELLMEGEYSVKQISMMVGYQVPNYFTWSFKKATGISPVKYRYFQNSKGNTTTI